MNDFNSTSAPHGQIHVGDVPPNFGRAWLPPQTTVLPHAGPDYSDVLDRIADALEELVLQASLKKDPLDDFEWMGTPPEEYEKVLRNKKTGALHRGPGPLLTLAPQNWEHVSLPVGAASGLWSEVNFQESDHDNPSIVRGSE